MKNKSFAFIAIITAIMGIFTSNIKAMEGKDPDSILQPQLMEWQQRVRESAKKSLALGVGELPDEIQTRIQSHLDPAPLKFLADHVPAIAMHWQKVHYYGQRPGSCEPRLFIQYNDNEPLIDPVTKNKLEKSWQNVVAIRKGPWRDNNKMLLMRLYGNEDDDDFAQLIDTASGRELHRWNNFRHRANFSDDYSMVHIRFSGCHYYGFNHNILAVLRRCNFKLHLPTLNAKQYELLQGFAQTVKDTHNRRVLRKDRTLPPVQIEADETIWQTYQTLPEPIKTALKEYIKKPTGDCSVL